MMLPHEPMSKREEEDRRMVNLSERLWLPVDTSPVMIILLVLFLDVFCFCLLRLLRVIYLAAKKYR